MIIKKIGSDYMVYDEQKQHTHILNTTAGQIYELLQQKKSVPEIVEILKKHFSVPEGHNLEQEILEYIQELQKKGLA